MRVCCFIFIYIFVVVVLCAHPQARTLSHLHTHTTGDFLSVCHFGFSHFWLKQFVAVLVVVVAGTFVNC